MEHFSDITRFLATLSEEASRIMRAYYSPLGFPSEPKSDSSPLTKADLEVNSMVIRMVREHYPEYGVLGEEESDKSEERKKLFVVDPLDGTLMFSKGSPIFGFSAAVVEDGVPIAGVLSNPIAQRTILAEKGKGAFYVEGNVQVAASNKTALKGALVNNGWRQSLLPRMLHERGAVTPCIYAISEAAALVSTGAFDGEVFCWNTAYDVAAAKIVVEEAGGKVTDLEGNEQRYDRPIRGAIISNGGIHDELVSMVRESGLINLVKEWGIID